MADFGDDFGELYADVDFLAFSAGDSAPKSIQSYTNSSHQRQFNRETSNAASDDSSDEQHLCDDNDANLGGEEGKDTKSGTDNVGNGAEGDGNESDDEDDDFVVVVNNDDFGVKSGASKSGGVDGMRGNDEIRDDTEVEFGVTQANFNLPGNQIDHGGGGGGCKGEVIGNERKLNGGNSQFKYVRQNGTASMETQRATRLRRVDREDFQPRRSSCGRFEQTYAGSTVHGFGDQGNGFWLPRYRTIVDVDIDTLEQKPWTHSGADMTDYFNFGFDENSWKSYCQALGQVRHQSFTQLRNQGHENLRSILSGATKEPESEEFAERESVGSGHRRSSQELCLATRQFNRQIGQAIRVEDCNTERLPSVDTKPPRLCDSDVVIEITAQEQESSDSLREPHDNLEAKFGTSEMGHEQDKLERETQISEDSEACEWRTAEENVCSPTSSSDLRRSHESATVSSGMLEKSCTQTEGLNSQSDTQKSGKADSFSGRNHTGQNLLKDDANSDRDSTATNPCVAGIDLSSDDHILSSTTSSYSLSEDLRDDLCDLRKNRNSQRSSPDYVVDRSQVDRVDHHRSRVSKRDDTERKGSCHKHPSRAGSSIKDYHKHSRRNFSRHSEMKSHNRDDKDYHIDPPKHMLSGGQSRLHHRDEGQRRQASDFSEDWPSYREKYNSLKCYDRHTIENQFHTECEGDSFGLHHWGSRDDISLNTLRRLDEDQFYSERSRRMRGDSGVRKRYLDEQDFLFRKEKHPFHKPLHSLPKYCSYGNMDRQSRYRENHDDYLNKRSKRDSPVEYGYSDFPMTDIYVDSPMDGLRREYVDLEIEHQRDLYHFRREEGIFDSRDEFFVHPSSDLKHPRFIREDYEYHSEQAFPFIHDYHDKPPISTERWHYSSFGRDDADHTQISPIYERNRRCISAKKSRDVTQPYDNKVTYAREDTRAYLDQDDYYDNKRHVFQSDGMDWQEDALLDHDFRKGVCNEMLNSVNGNPRHKRHGARHGFVPNEMTIHAQGVKDRHDAFSAGGKFSDQTSKMPTRPKHERTELWYRSPVGLSNFTEKKSNGNVSKPETTPNNDACSHDGRFQNHRKDQQVLDASFSRKTMVNKALKVEESRDRPSDMSRYDLGEGRIPIEYPRRKDLKAKKFDSVVLAKRDNLKGQLTHSQKSVSKNGSCVYDESQILATMTKMEKRRERFKEPLLVKKDGDSDPKPQVAKLVETAESIGQRPRRKRPWGDR